ncbi:MAG: hypothetical protein COB36_07380 [Alphaproteobacteria bacterium]|nr:MAG: hypothetical protein COB36_07380 [Alphaproteobacteria bacterium]
MLEKIKKTNNFLQSIGFLFVFLVSFSANMALATEHEEKTTPKERAVFAFFRAAGTVPDYDFWIKSSGRYNALSENHKTAYILDEILRLGRGYSAYDADEDMLELKINVIVKYISGTEDKKPRITFEFFQVDEAYVPTFSYPYGDDVISLIIDRLAAFSNVPLDDAQKETLLPKVPYVDEYFDAKLIVHVRVSRAETEKPIITNGVKQWLMIGDVAHLKCEVEYMGKNRLLWDFVAPWYEEAFEEKNRPEEEKYPHPYDLFKD